MSPLYPALALGPLAVYLLLLGILNMARRPFITTGLRDIIALGVALTGLLIVGPMDLFLPQNGLVRLGVWSGPVVWLLVLWLYWFCALLLAMRMKPRLVVYNFTQDELRSLLIRVIERMQWEHHWAGEGLSLPGLGVQLHFESFRLMRNVSLVANGAQQSFRGWGLLEKELVGELSGVEVPPNPIGLSLVTFSVLIFGLLCLRMAQNPTAVAHSLLDLLRMS